MRNDPCNDSDRQTAEPPDGMTDREVRPAPGGAWLARRSELSDRLQVLRIAVSPERLTRHLQATGRRPYVQNAFPDLDADDREFILTGITPQESDRLFREEEEQGSGDAGGAGH